MTTPLSDDDYQRLLEWRTGLRQFLRWSEQQAAEVGLTGAQHQLLLAIRGHPHQEGPTVGDVAAYLLLRHHSAVGLVNRAEGAGLVRRVGDKRDGRTVRLRLTRNGRRRLERLARQHVDELARLGPRVRPLWRGLGEPGEGSGRAASQADGERRRSRRASMTDSSQEKVRSSR